MPDTPLARNLVKLRIALLALAAVLAIIAFPAAQRIDFDRSIENMFAPDDPLLPPYQRLKETFGGNEIVVAVYRDADLFAPDAQGIQRLRRIRRQLEAVPGVESVLSVDRLIGDDIVNEDHLLAEPMRELFASYTHSEDGTVAALVCMLTPEQDTAHPRQQTIDQLRQLMQPLPSGMITGEPVMVVDGFRLVEQDGARLAVVSTLLLALTIVICFRSLRWVLVPVLVVQLTLLLTQATLVWTGVSLSMVSSMLTAIVTVIGVATVVHIIVRFRQYRSDLSPPRHAITLTIGLLAWPIFWACTTDAVGFASLLVAEVGPVRDFGVMMAVGALFVIVSVALLVPGLASLGRIDPDPREVWGERHLTTALMRLLHLVDRRPMVLALGTGVFSVLAIAGVSRLEIETDFTKNFRRTSPIVQAYDFAETNLGGAGVLDLMLPAPEQLSWTYLKQVQQLQERLRQEVVVANEAGEVEPGLTKVLSLSDAVIAGSPVDLDEVRPLLRGGVVQGALRVMRTQMPVFADALHAPDAANPSRHTFRIMLRARERQPADAKLELIRQVRTITEEELNREEWQQILQELPGSPSAEDAELTGVYVLLVHLIRSIVRDQWVCFAVAVIGIGLMMIVALRSVRLAAIALVPNALPILIVLGLMGWLGLRINMGAAMIAAVSMGLSIDSSIHYLTSYRRRRAAGRGVREALEDVQQTVGLAAAFSTLALIVGFAVLCTSEFVPTIYFGFLVMLAMLGGLLGNLLVLPLLLQATERDVS